LNDKIELNKRSSGQTFRGVTLYHSTPLIKTLNNYNSQTTRPKFDFYVLKYLDKYSALEYEIKTLLSFKKGKNTLKKLL